MDLDNKVEYNGLIITIQTILKMNIDNSCPICTEKYTDCVRAKTNCPYCDFICCRKCCETFLLNENIPRCMNNECRKEWTRHHLFNAFSKSFVNKTLKAHREKVLFEKELALLPATQHIVERLIESEKVRAEIDELDLEISALYAKRREMELHWGHLRNNTYNQSRTARQFIRACPDEHCRGFLSQQWKCGICEKYTCSECHIIKNGRNDDEHVCNPDDVATAKLIASDTKPCPKCATGIFKIEGCDQMWCTSCNTGFNWRSGQIETRLHNPHYFEWLQRTGGAQNTRTPGDIQCGRELDWDFTRRLRRNMESKIPSVRSKKAMKIIESINHLRDVMMDRYQTNDVENNEDLRISYMRNLISEEAFKITIQRENKKRDKKREIFEVLDMFVNASIDIMYRFSDSVDNLDVEQLSHNEIYNDSEIENKRILDEIDKIVDYANECLTLISRVYASKRLHIRIRRSDEREYNPVLESVSI